MGAQHGVGGVRGKERVHGRCWDGRGAESVGQCMQRWRGWWEEGGEREHAVVDVEWVRGHAGGMREELSVRWDGCVRRALPRQAWNE